MSRGDDDDTGALHEDVPAAHGGVTAWWTRLRAAVGMGVAQLRSVPARTVLAVVGIAVAVLATTLLASTGFGVLAFGEEQFDNSRRDLWVTGGEIRLNPDSGSAFQGSIFDAHEVSARIEKHEKVQNAPPIALRAVYIGTNPEDLKLITGVGHKRLGQTQYEAGQGFSKGDIHYANGTYSGPMTREVVIDPRTAALLNVSVGDRIYLGGSKATARDNQFEVVGITSRFSAFVGAPTAVVHLSELQTVTGAAGSDRATFIAVRLKSDADPVAVRDDLAAEFPQYDVLTSQEQLRQTLQQNAIVITASGILVALAVVAGVALTANLLAIIVAQQRTELAVLRAIGLSRWTVVLSIGSQAVVLALLGGAVGLISTPLAVAGLNELIVAVVGFESLLRTPTIVYQIGAAVALGIGTLSAVGVALQAMRIPPLVTLRE